MVHRRAARFVTTGKGTPAASQTRLTVSVGRRMRQGEANCSWLFSSKPYMVLLKYHPQGIWHRQHQGQDQHTLLSFSSILHLQIAISRASSPDNTVMQQQLRLPPWHPSRGSCPTLASNGGGGHPSHERTPEGLVLSCVGGPGCPCTPREVELVTLRWAKCWWEQTF